MAILSYSSCEWSCNKCIIHVLQGEKTKKGIFSDLFFYMKHTCITIYGMSLLSMTINGISAYFPLQHSNLKPT